MKKDKSPEHARKTLDRVKKMTEEEAEIADLRRKKGKGIVNFGKMLLKDAEKTIFRQRSKETMKAEATAKKFDEHMKKAEKEDFRKADAEIRRRISPKKKKDKGYA
jgi:hypothetical protein